MRRINLAGFLGPAACCVALAGCVTPRPALAPAPWEERAAELQRARAWQLDGRAAVAVGGQGWQASMTWRQDGMLTELHLAGPLGVGAIVLARTPEGLSLNGAPPSDTVVSELEGRLGFALPLDTLRYWLLGVPDPGMAFDMTRNDMNRAAQITQAGWTVMYDRYSVENGDWLPARLTLTREGVRVRIAVDRWQVTR